MARTIRLLITQKRLNLAPPKLVTFGFYLLGVFWQNFSKINSPGGCWGRFRNEMSGNTEHMNYFVSLENQGNAKRGVILGQKSSFQT